MKQFLKKVWYKLKEKLSPNKRRDIFKLFPKDSVGVEIGVFTGEFSKQILRYAQPKKMHFIDGWWEIYGEFFPDWGEYTNFGKLSTHDAYQQFLIKTEPFKDKTKIEIHVGNDLEILSQFPDHYFDWAYVDSSHEYEHTLNELKILSFKIKPDGIISGHDYILDPNHIHYGVKKAIEEFCQQYSFELFYLDRFTQWAIRKKNI